MLSLLSEAPEQRLRVYELARIAGWEKSRMHHQFTRMGNRGLTVRERCGSRGMEAVITQQGFAALEEAAPDHAQEVRRVFIDRLTPEEFDQFAAIAGKILNGLREDLLPPDRLTRQEARSNPDHAPATKPAVPPTFGH